MWSHLHLTVMVDHLLLVLLIPTTQKNCHTRYCQAYTYASVNFIKSDFVLTYSVNSNIRIEMMTYSVNSNIRIEMMYNWFLHALKWKKKVWYERFCFYYISKTTLRAVFQPGQCLSETLISKSTEKCYTKLM
jgi:hypothetical protein